MWKFIPHIKDFSVFRGFSMEIIIFRNFVIEFVYICKVLVATLLVCYYTDLEVATNPKI